VLRSIVEPVHAADTRGIDTRGIDTRGIDMRGIDTRGIDMRARTRAGTLKDKAV
jgi:hypothetical protein